MVAMGCAIGCTSASAQNNFDTSGNGMLKGAYFVRQVLLANLDPNTSAIGEAISIIGTMTFDGNGNYTFSGQKTDSSASSTAQSYTTSGMYNVASNGMVQIQNPIDSTDVDYGGIGAVGPNGIVASATEGPYDDIFIAIPAGTSASNSSVQGTYQAGFLDFLNNNASQVRDGYFTFTSTGNGSFGNVTVNGAMANQSSNNTTQSLTGVTYSVGNANGSGTVTFPTSSSPLTTLVSGQKTFYVSADGNILLAGNPSGFDIVVGIKAVSGATNSMLQGTYYTTALENDASDLGDGNNNIDSFYGSTLALGQGTTISHLRLVSFEYAAYDDTIDSTYNFASNGTDQTNYFGSVSANSFEKMLGDGGQAVIIVGRGDEYSLSLGLQTKAATGTAVLLDPVKIWNAASFAPITNSVAPGEFVSIFGSGLSSSTLSATVPYPTTLGGVSVTVNSRPAPLTYVSPTQINLLLPYATGPDSNEAYAYFQVTNNGVKSNQAMVYTLGTAPGVFTVTGNGVGPAAVTHADGSLVTQSSPAKAGETLVLYVTGLGDVSPAVADGVAAPSSPLSTVNDPNLIVEIQDQQFNFYDPNIVFAGLTPGFAGLDQINFTIPSGIPSGTAWINVGTSDAYTSEAKIYMQ